MAKKKATKKTAKKKATKKLNKSDKSLLWRSFPKRPPEMIVRDINMKFGNTGPIIRPANEAWDASDLRRPCGITSLDVALGGGLIAGKVHQFDGPEGIGKNYLLYRFFANVQKHYGEDTCLAMACFESFVDKHFAQLCGCKIAMSPYDIEVSQRARLNRGEELLTEEEIDEALSCKDVGAFHIFEGPSEKVLDGIVYAVEANAYQLIGVDSWDAMITIQEDEKSIEEIPQVASPATVQTRFSKKVLDAFNPVFRCPECGFAPLTKRVTSEAKMNFKYVCPTEKGAGGCGWSGDDPAVEVNETSVYCIRQVRAKIQTTGKRQFGRPYEAKGAHSLKHLNHARVSANPGAFLTNKSGKKIGKEVNWEVTKAKAGAREGQTGQFVLYFDPLEVDTIGDLFAQAEIFGVIKKRDGGWYSIPDIDMEDVHGKNSMIDLIEREPDLQQSISELVYIKAGLSHVRFR